MIKQFSSYQIVGRGRAKTLGFPTINLKIPENFDLKEGVYGVYIFINEIKYLAVLYYGDSPTFDKQKKTLEFFLIDSKKIPESNNKNIKVEIIKYLRPVKKFENKKKLIKQIEVDVKNIKFLSK